MSQSPNEALAAGGPLQLSNKGRKQPVKLLIFAGLRYIMPFIALAAGGLITLHLLNTGPEAKPMPSKKNSVSVKTMIAQHSTHPTRIYAMGLVKASRSVSLTSQVSGQVIGISDKMVPGGRFTRGDILVQLDQRDYRLKVKQQQSTVAQAQSDLQLEQGNQVVAARELALLGEQVSEQEKALMLRRPQLSNLENALEIATAELDQALLELERTTLKAPFNGIVQSRDVDVGTWVSTSVSTATLIGSDSYWVEISVPEEQLQWVNLPAGEQGSGSEVKIFNPTAWGEDVYRQGRVIQLLPGLETQGRMARLLVEMDDPLALKPENVGKPKVLVDSFVRVVVEGKSVAAAVEFPREYLRDGNRLWLFDRAGKLVIREVEIAFKNKDSVLVTTGISEGEEVVVSDIAVPVEGMRLDRLDMRPDKMDSPKGNLVAAHSASAGAGKEGDHGQ